MATLAIKSGTTAIAGSTVKGSFSYFSGSTKDLGPTSSTGFYSGVDAPTGGYTVYQVGGSGGWTARVATDTTSLNSILISAGGTGSTVDQNITWATNTNSVYINSGATPYTVGQAALGGIVAYILQPGDPGYSSIYQHGLIAATSDQGSGKISWGCLGTSISGAASLAIGSGAANTAAILAACSTRPIAASLCTTYTGGGYTDWYLPSVDELNKLYLNKDIIGGFTTDAYWASTQSDVYYAYLQDFYQAYQYPISKASLISVRAIRSF